MKNMKWKLFVLTAFVGWLLIVRIVARTLVHHYIWDAAPTNSVVRSNPPALYASRTNVSYSWYAPAYPTNVDIEVEQYVHTGITATDMWRYGDSLTNAETILQLWGVDKEWVQLCWTNARFPRKATLRTNLKPYLTNDGDTWTITFEP